MNYRDGELLVSLVFGTLSLILQYSDTVFSQLCLFLLLLLLLQV
jgi:hypothetical protein